MIVSSICRWRCFCYQLYLSPLLWIVVVCWLYICEFFQQLTLSDLHIFVLLEQNRRIFRQLAVSQFARWYITSDFDSRFISPHQWSEHSFTILNINNNRRPNLSIVSGIQPGVLTQSRNGRKIRRVTGFWHGSSVFRGPAINLNLYSCPAVAVSEEDHFVLGIIVFGSSFRDNAHSHRTTSTIAVWKVRCECDNMDNGGTWDASKKISPLWYFFTSQKCRRRRKLSF